MDLTIRQLTKKFNDQIVLHDINADFEQGSVTCITGPSGCGKTTLIHCILGLYKPDSGEITGAADTRFAAVFQENRLCPQLDAITNVQLACKKNVSAAEICTSLDAMGLTDYAGKQVSSLSGGMKRRVSILRALMAESDCIIMDEPFKGLDDALKDQVISYIRNKAKGKTLLVVTHDLRDAEKLNAKILTLTAFQQPFLLI